MKAKSRYYSYLRFSTPEQATGDSIRRQTALAEKWAQENGATLDDSLRMQDHGVSGYDQKNASEGAALGRFLAAIKAGQVPRGSVLLVESLDRLSRATVKDALRQFMNILEAGVDIVTLGDKQRYSWETIDEKQLIISIFIASRAHEESANKSRRISSVWSEKHRQARTEKKPVTRRIPAWIRLDDSGAFQLIEERAALIRRIFQEAQNGDGVELISRRLNREDVPPWGTSFKRNRESATPVWNKSYIAKILTNGAVCGRYVPSTLVDGKRTPQEAIEDFYPAVISKEVFLQTREAMSSRTLGAGRTGRVSNLFPHLLKCGYCGENAQHVNKGVNGKKSGANGGEFLACSLARVGKGCEYHGLPYQPFERAFLEYCREVDLTALLQQDSRAEAIVQAQADLDTATGALKATQAKIDGLLAIISKVENPTMADRLAKELDAAGVEQEDRQRGHEAATIRLEGLKRTGQTVADHVDSIREILGRLEGIDDEERVTLRKKLKHAIARAVERITIYPAGLQGRELHFTDHGIEALPRTTGFTAEDEARLMELLPADCSAEEAMAEIAQAEAACLEDYTRRTTGKDKAVFLVRFRNGHSRAFQWDQAEKAFQQIMAETGDHSIVAGIRFDLVGGRLQIGSV